MANANILIVVTNSMLIVNDKLENVLIPITAKQSLK